MQSSRWSDVTVIELYGSWWLVASTNPLHAVLHLIDVHTIAHALTVRGYAFRVYHWLASTVAQVDSSMHLILISLYTG